MKQSTGIKLLSSLSAVALILVFGMLLLNMRASNQFDVLTEQGDRVAGYAEQFINTSAYLTQEVRSYVITGDPNHYNNYWREVNTDQNREKAVAELKEAGIPQEEEEWITQIQALSNNLVPLEDQAMKLAQQGEYDRAVGIVYGSTYETNMSKIHELGDKLTESIWKRTTEDQQQYGFLIDVTFLLTFISLALVVAIQVVVIFYVLRRILAPLIHIQNNMSQMAQGNLDAALAVEEDGTELGELSRSINETKRSTASIIQDIDNVLGEMAEGNFTVSLDHAAYYVGAYAPILESMKKLKSKQSQTLQQIGAAAEQVAMGSGQVSNGAQALAQGATEQASAVEELSATISDISNSARSNAENSAMALEHSRKAAAFVTESAGNIREMVSAMGDISLSSQEIGKIIATIENIAFQTNILALNAAVEAARAGAAGKGFAVVADEVRNLASKSDEAAKATKELINSSVETVKRGESIVGQVSQALDSTIEASRQAEQDIAQITQAIQEETESIAQVAEGIDQISSVVQTNSATSEESAAASEELSSQAEMLKELIGRFRVSDN